MISNQRKQHVIHYHDENLISLVFTITSYWNEIQKRNYCMKYIMKKL